MTGAVPGGDGLFKPEQVVWFQGAPQLDGFRHRQALIGIGHQFDIRTNGVAYGFNPFDILCQGDLTQPDLHCLKALFQEILCFLDKISRACGQPHPAAGIGRDTLAAAAKDPV